MKELKTKINIFDLPISKTGSEAVCVTTNGNIKKNGLAVMGRGIALEANKRFNLTSKLAKYLNLYGNRLFDMGIYQNQISYFHIITFPTKYNWTENSNLELIEKSCQQLVELCNKRNISICYLTPVGCANGHLDYQTQVKPILEKYLDDRFIIVFRN